jgi:hypothetical protein
MCAISPLCSTIVGESVYNRRTLTLVDRHRSTSEALQVLRKMSEKAGRVGVVRVVGQVLYDPISAGRW